MIKIACTNCREVLTIDDAFAGGVCRCQHCGTIQTVPAAAGTGEVAVGGPNLGGSRPTAGNGPVFSGTAPADGTGLDDLAGAVASSGLSSRRLLSRDRAAGRRPAPASTAGPAPARSNLLPLFVAAGAVIVVLLGVIVYMATRPSSAAPALGTSAPQPPGPAAITPVAAANFCGTPLTDDTVVYLLDRGTATQDVFEVLKNATLRSAASLGSDHHFQIVFWANPGDDPPAYPTAGTAYATPQNIDAARRALDDVSAFGQTDVRPALTLALAQHPGVVVIATAKAWELDSTWAKDVMAARGSSTVRFDTFSLGGASPSADPGPTSALKAVADRTGGTYAALSNDQLKAAAD